jgi:hypothetical protein
LLFFPIFFVPGSPRLLDRKAGPANGGLHPTTPSPPDNGERKIAANGAVHHCQLRNGIDAPTPARILVIVNCAVAYRRCPAVSLDAAAGAAGRVADDDLSPSLLAFRHFGCGLYKQLLLPIIHGRTSVDFNAFVMQDCYAFCLSLAFYERTGEGGIRTLGCNLHFGTRHPANLVVSVAKIAGIRNPVVEFN